MDPQAPRDTNITEKVPLSLLYNPSKFGGVGLLTSKLYTHKVSFLRAHRGRSVTWPQGNCL